MQTSATENTFELWRKGNFKKAVLMSIDFDLQQQLQSEFNVIQKMVKADQIDLLLRFISGNAALSKAAIVQCSSFKHIKTAGKIIENCNFNPMDFPQVISLMKKSSMRYFLNSSDQGLFELIELVEDDYECLALVVEDLEFKCSKRGIAWMGELGALILRNHPRVTQYVRKQVVSKLSRMPATQRGMPPDQFCPSNNSYLSLPIPQDAVLVVDTDEIVSRVEWTYPVYGLDCEWRPNLIKFESYPVSIMQVACESQVYIFDMLALKHSSLLDAKLCELFSNPSIVKVGMAFEGDLKMLRSSLPGFEAFKHPMNAYGDISKGFKIVMPDIKPGGLTGICQSILGQPLCKAKQRSDWSRRPLCLGQLHYASLDAHCQIKLWEEIGRLMNEQGKDSQELLVNLGEQKPQSIESRGKKCKNCSKFGHQLKECPRGPRCNVCSEFGHVSRSCSQFSGS